MTRDTAIFSAGELAGRAERLRERLDDRGLDAFLATSYPNSYYLSGAPIHPFGRPIATIIPRKGEPAMVISVIEIEHVRVQTWIEDIRLYWDFNPTPDMQDPRPPLTSMGVHLSTLIADRGLSRARIGYEDATLPVAHLRALQEAMPAVQFEPASDLVDRLRLVLSGEELAFLRAADDVARVGQRWMLESMQDGASAQELERGGREAMKAAALSRYPEAAFALRAWPGIAADARGSGHSEWASWGPQDKLRPGQIATGVLDCVLWGYTGNIERTVVIGEPSSRVRRDFETMIEARERAIEAVRPGVRLREIDAICKQVFSRHGHETRTGSGVGRGLISYEGNHRILAMDMRPYNDLVLEAGMAFSVEPDLQTEDGTYRHCDTVIVTAGGNEIDSSVERGVLVR